MNDPSVPFCVLGAGSWGTALAMQAARSGRPVRLWGRSAEQLQAMAADHANRQYLPGFRFPDSLTPEPELAHAVAGAPLVMIAVPSHAFAATLKLATPHLAAGARICWSSKGFEPETGRLLHLVAQDLLPDHDSGAILTGPSFAREVAADLPTAVTVASPDAGLAEAIVRVFHHGSFRAYRTDDIVGAELGGAMKNVMAIGTGIADGIALGTNARAAMITRGLAEMMRLSDALGGRRETLTGLSGMGDLVLTCTGDLSRNRRYGLARGEGRSHEEALREIQQVVEGVGTAQALLKLAAAADVELPISEQIYRIVTGEITPRDGVRNLMSREPRVETD
ncbi:MAG: NAD(P)H-dependent glycerol-3-phosphate dehydrogenase [Pseudomonadota bacterium]